jgi:hypothetical protein
MSDVKSKIIQFRVTAQDYDTLSRLAQYLHGQGQSPSHNPHLLAKEYTLSLVSVSIQQLDNSLNSLLTMVLSHE